MKLGLIGLANSGKTTLFNALTKGNAATSTHLFSTTKPNIGTVSIPDERLEKLTEIFKPKKTTPAYIEFVDIAGLVKGSGSGEGVGNKFLVNIREVDALVHVVRCFKNASIASAENDPENDLDPSRDIETVNLELIISDLEIIEKRITSIEKKTRNVLQHEKLEREILLKLKSGLEDGTPARNINLTENEIKLIKSFCLLSLKPVIYCANISEEDLENKNTGAECEPGHEPLCGSECALKVMGFAEKEGAPTISVCARIEEEISHLDPADKVTFMEEMNIKESGLGKLIKASYKLLGLISFLTAGTDEVRAWTIKKDEKAPTAAGKIHSDIERGFIRAETVSFTVFMEAGGSFVKAREKGLLRSEGKDYIVSDGDIIDFRFNV